MDRSFPFLNKGKILTFLFAAALATVMNALHVMLTDIGPTMYNSTYATMFATMMGLFMLILQEQVSKWNSFVIASGTDRSDFIRTRFINTALYVALSAALLTCIEFAFYGLSDITIKLLLMNVTLSLIACSVCMYIFCHMGMTIRSQPQMSGLIIILAFSMIIGGTLTAEVAMDGRIGVVPIIGVLVASAAITVLSYFACMRRIKRVDM